MSWSHSTVRRRVLVAFALLLGVACARRSAEQGSDSASAAGATPLAGVEWRLVELEGRPVVGGTIDRPPYIRFTSDSLQVAGYSGCNFLSGSYEVSATAIRFGQLITTKRACADPDANAQEVRFVRALERADGFAVEGSRLTLSSGSQPVARFERGEPGQGDGQASEPSDRPLLVSPEVDILAGQGMARPSRSSA